MDLDGGLPKFFLVETLFPCRYLQIDSFIDNSVCHSRPWFNPGSVALQESFSRISKFIGTLLLRFSSGSNSNINKKLHVNSRPSDLINCEPSAHVYQITHTRHDLSGFCCISRLKVLEIPELFTKFSRFTTRQLMEEFRKLQLFPAFSLACALIPPLDNVSRNVLGDSLENGYVLAQRFMNQIPCEVEQHRRCSDLSYGYLNCSNHAVEPRTGIEFPTILDNIFGETNSSLISEVLVGTGSRTMKIVKIKSLKLYAFGFYVHPYDVCKKLGPKYGSIPESDVNKHHSFYADLLREDISMTVRLVVSCNGIKISTVRDAFEKSLRARLMKTNPDTDYECVKAFGSIFSQDIPIRVGTTIDFRRTADGHLVTEIEGNQIGSVRSKDLCRAFFDMYIGEVPLSEQSKVEIGKNVVNIMRRC